jgi:crotonobetainyl-CoA:carnitine CoA-transferase CaiB-like acyl-CoA transferase
VLVTNIRASALARLGLDPETLLTRNERLIYALITGYGLDGPDADRAAYDIAAYWARSGLAAALTPPGGQLPFQRCGMGDHSVAMTAAAMVSAALVARARTGKGQLVSTSLPRQGAYTIGFDVNVALMWGRSIAVGSREAMGNPAINNYTAGDGRRFWIVGLEGERHWPLLARVVGRAEWIDDPGYATPRAGFENARSLIAELDEIFATKPLDEWAEVLATEPDFFWSPVNTLDDLLADEQFHAAGALVDVPDEDGGSTMLASPADFHDTPSAARFRAPRIGEHTREVLTEIGRAADYEDLIAAGAIRGDSEDRVSG